MIRGQNDERRIPQLQPVQRIEQHSDMGIRVSDLRIVARDPVSHLGTLRAGRWRTFGIAVRCKTVAPLVGSVWIETVHPEEEAPAGVAPQPADRQRRYILRVAA